MSLFERYLTVWVFLCIGVTLFVNWLVKPFSMAFLAWLFIRNLFAPLLPVEQLDS